MMKVNLIRSRLALRNMTQKDLARQIGISRNTMSSRMTGKSSFTLEEVDRICEILGIRDKAEAKEIFLS